MDSLQPTKIIKPESILIEQTALELAAVFYEAGRSSGLKSKHKNARSFAKAKVTTFIPKAVELLMDMLANPATPQTSKDAIYDAFMERTNDDDLSNIGIDAFKNDTKFTSDKVILDDPIIWNTTIDKALNDAIPKMFERNKSGGKEN